MYKNNRVQINLNKNCVLQLSDVICKKEDFAGMDMCRMNVG